MFNWLKHWLHGRQRPTSEETLRRAEDIRLATLDQYVAVMQIRRKTDVR